MELKKIPIVFSFLVMALTSMAQNSPLNFLDAHNPARAEVGVAPLIWNATVAVYAQNYANERSIDCELVHSKGPYGENLAMGSWDLSAKEAVDMWINEKQYYNYNSNACVGGQQCLHYTQVVWRNSVSVGCARALCKNGGTFVTCNYDPPGNYIGERPY